MTELVHFMGRWLPLLVLAVLLGCRTPPNLDYTRVGKDIDLLTEEEPKIKDPWQILDLLPRISRDTLIFLKENDYYCDPASPARPSFCETARRLKVIVNSTGMSIHSQRPPTLPPTSLSKELDAILSNRFSELEKENKVYYWEKIDRTREPHYCQHECLCISIEMAKTLKLNPTVKGQIYVRLQPLSGLGVKVRGPTGYVMDFPIHHTALFVKFADGGWGVVDKLAFGDTKVRTVQEWSQHIEEFPRLSVGLEPVFNDY